MAYNLDQASLESLRWIVQAEDPCIYLEIGSELGQSLVPALLDPKCIAVHSVDLRSPIGQPDERGRTWAYSSTTQQMRDELAQQVTQEDMFKLTTYDMDTTAFAEAFTVPANLVFLDAEHTNAAAFQDFMNLIHMLPTDHIFAGHDSNLVFDAVINIAAMLKCSKVPFHLAYLPDVVFAFAFGKYIEPVKALPHWDPKEYVRYARQTLNDEIIANVHLRPRIPNTGVLI